MEIYSLQIERHVLSGILRHPSIFCDVDIIINEHDFYNDVHQTIFSVLRDTFRRNERPDKVLIAQKVKNLGISFKEDIDIFEYLDSISFNQITDKAAMHACQELKKITVRREIAQAGQKVTAFAHSCGDQTIDQIVAEVDQICNQRIGSYATIDEPKNIFEDLEALIEGRGNNPVEEMGLKTPFSEFNRMFGGLQDANIYAFASRGGEGKSTILNHMAFHTSKMNNFKIPALFLDTEMQTESVQFRMASNLTGVPYWYLDTGNWRKDPEMERAVRAALKVVKNYKYYHYEIGNKSIDEVISFVRRWHMTKVGRGNKSIICYDYMKLTSEKVGQNWAEYQALGQKIDKLHQMSKEIKVPVLTAVQLNRSGENKNKVGSEVGDNSSAISGSDRLLWFASFVAIFRRKTLDELENDGQQFGTHKLVPLKTRFQGKDAAGHHDIIKRPIGDKFKYESNYLNYQIDKFNVIEKGSLRDVVDAASNKVNIAKKPEANSTDGNLL